MGAYARAMRSPVVFFVLLSTFFIPSQSFPTTNPTQEPTSPEPEPEPDKELKDSKQTTPEPEPDPEKLLGDSEPTTSEPEPEPEKPFDSSKTISTTKKPASPEPEPKPEPPLDNSEPATPEPEAEPAKKLDDSKPKTSEPEPEPEKDFGSSTTTKEPTTSPEPEPEPEKAVNPSKTNSTTKEPTASPESEPEPEKSFDTSSSTHEPTTLPQPEPEPTHVYSKTETKLSTEQETALGTTPTTKPEKSDDRSTTYYTCMTCTTETPTTKQQKVETFDPPTRIPSTKPEISVVPAKEVTNRPDPERTPKKRSELAIKKMPETMFEELVAKAGRFLRHEIPEGGVRKARQDTVHETNCETCVGLELEFDESLRTPSIGTKLIPFEATDAHRPDGWFDGSVPELSSKFQRPRGARFNPGLTQRIRPIPIISRPRSPKTNLEPRPRSPKTNLRPRRPRKQTESTSSSLWANLAWLGKTLYQYLYQYQSSSISSASSTTSDTVVKQIGYFVELHHGVAGDVFALDEETIVIKNFVYDGQGPDAFILAGTSGQPSKGGEVVFPIPNDDGRTYAYTDKDIPILGRFTGDEDVVLRLPPGRRVSDLKWLSVWCREYAVDFGHTGIDA